MILNRIEDISVAVDSFSSKEDASKEQQAAPEGEPIPDDSPHWLVSRYVHNLLTRAGIGVVSNLFLMLYHHF